MKLEEDWERRTVESKYDKLADMTALRIRREQARLDEARRSAALMELPPVVDMKATDKERGPGRLSPTCIVEGYLYADVALLVGPGSTGKTTLFLFECIHVILGLRLYGMEVVTPGPVVFVTAEDPREILFARLWRLMEGMGLDAEQISKVYDDFYIWDVSGTVRRLAELDPGGNVVLTWVSDAMVDRFKAVKPVIVCFDPTISFGAGERIVNDNEQALITTARRVKNGLGCCVRYIHHTGKESSREGFLDQYAGRGGSALPDGARMVVVIQPSEVEESPVHLMAKEGDQVYMLAIPKMSYAAPQQPIWLKREGYKFLYARDLPVDKEADKRARMDQVHRFLGSELKEGRMYSMKSLEAVDLMPRAKLRAAVELMRVWRMLEDRQLPHGVRGTGPQRFLCPLTSPKLGGEV